MENGWKIANVIYIKVRLEETNYASDSAAPKQPSLR